MAVPTISEVADKMKSDVSSVLYNTINTSLDALSLPAKMADDFVTTMMPQARQLAVLPSPNVVPVPQIVTRPFPTPFGYIQLPVVEFGNQQPQPIQQPPQAPKPAPNPTPKPVAFTTISAGPVAGNNKLKEAVESTPSTSAVSKSNEYVFAIGR